MALDAAGATIEPTAAAPAPSCAGCHYYRAATAVSELTRGDCRRYPASIAKLPHEWCGEFFPKGS